MLHRVVRREPMRGWPIPLALALLAVLAGCGPTATNTTQGHHGQPTPAARPTSAQAPAVKIVEYVIPTPYGAPDGLAAGPDGNLWYTEGHNGADVIGRVTPAGSITQYPIPPLASESFAAGPTGITTGPDGALWFANGSLAGQGSRIGRISTGGALTNFAVAGGPDEIAMGSDGNLWFTDYLGTIDRFTTAGALSRYRISAPNIANYIMAGPDVALWFTESGYQSGAQIGRISTKGALTEYPLPNSASNPMGIAVGPDHALWFAEQDAGKIGRITTTGAITEYAIPTHAGGPKEIAVGKDGALWFTETKSDKIGRITTTGQIAEYAIPSQHGTPWNIAAGPDGTIWFTELDANKLGHLTFT